MGLGFFLGGTAEGFNQGAKNINDILTQDKQRQLYGLQVGKLLREQQAGEEIAKLNQQGVLLPNNPPQERLSPNHPIYNETGLPSTTPQTNMGQGGITYSTTRDNPFESGGMSDLSVGSTNQQPFQTATQPVAKASMPQFPELDNFDKQIKQFENAANIYNSQGLPDHAKTYMSEAASLKEKKLQYAQKAAESYSKIANDTALSEETRLKYLNMNGALIDKVFGDGNTFKPFDTFDEEAKNASRQSYKIITSVLSGKTPLAVGLEDMARLNEQTGAKGQKAIKESMEFMEKAQTMQKKEEPKEYVQQLDQFVKKGSGEKVLLDANRRDIDWSKYDKYYKPAETSGSDSGTNIKRLIKATSEYDAEIKALQSWKSNALKSNLKQEVIDAEYMTRLRDITNRYKTRFRAHQKNWGNEILGDLTQTPKPPEHRKSLREFIIK